MARKVAFLVGATMLSSMLPGEELMSERAFVFLRPETSSFWHTATNSTLGTSCKALYRGGNTTRNYAFSHVACRRDWNDLNSYYGVCGFRLWMYAD